MKKNTIVIIMLLMYSAFLHAADTLERTAVFGKKGTGPSEIKSVADLEEKNGVLYILDSGNYKVITYREGAVPVILFGRFGSGSGEFNSPSRLAVDSKGCIYVLDYYRVDNDREKAGGWKQYYFPRIQKFSPDGRFMFSFGAAGVKDGEFLCTPSDMAVDKKDRLVVLDACNSRIQVFSPEGKFLLSYGSFGSCDSCMDRPYRIGIDGDNNVLVLDPGNSRFIKFDEGGKPLPMPDMAGKEDGQILGQNNFRILDNGDIAVIHEVSTGTGNVWNGTSGKYSITVRIKYFDKDGKFVKYADALCLKDFERPPFDYSLIYRSLIEMGPDNSVYLLDARNVTVEKYLIRDVFIDAARISKKVYAEGAVNGGHDRYFPDPAHPGYTETYDSSSTGRLGLNASYLIDDRSSLSVDLSGAYTKGITDSRAYLVPTPDTGYDSESYGGRAYISYNRTYDLNEGKNISAYMGYEYNGDLQWMYPDYITWHKWSHAVHSNLYGSAGIDILPNLNLTCGGNYYFWADYYDDEDYEHPDWNAYARFTLGF